MAYWRKTGRYRQVASLPKGVKGRAIKIGKTKNSTIWAYGSNTYFVRKKKR